MKAFHFFMYTFIVLVLAACTSEDAVVTSVRTSNGRIPQINFDKIPVQPRELSFSEIFENVQVIPLETSDECLINNVFLEFAEDFMFIATQHFPGPVRVYRFDNEGRFLNEIGSGGEGPGEHTSYMIESMQWLDNHTLALMWIDSRENVQLFNEFGKYIKDIKIPLYGMNNIYHLSDSTWFSVGKAAGSVRSEKDSVAVIFYDENGNRGSVIPRSEFPALSENNYTPEPGKPDVYKYQDIWKLYIRGNDTLYRIENGKLLPDVVLKPDQKAVPFNRGIMPEELVGNSELSILAETDNNWFVQKETYNEVDLKPYNDIWMGSFDTSYEMIIIDKNSGNAVPVKFVDDVFHFFSDELMTNFFSSGLLSWHKNSQVAFALPAYLVLQMLQDKSGYVIDDPELAKAVDQLKLLDENSNPVLFTFTLKERVEI